ncbi:MAG: response regulator [Nitrospinales bacterium]
MLENERLLNSKILIVDDERTHVLMLERALKKEGYKIIRSTTDPREVSGICKEFHPDLILLDIMMPYLNGHEVMKQIKEMRENNEIGEDSVQILVLTARTDPETAFLSYLGGARDYLEKPFTIPVVLLRIRNILEAIHLQNELRELKLENQRLREANG